jgi:hypothetical protein
MGAAARALLDQGGLPGDAAGETVGVPGEVGARALLFRGGILCRAAGMNGRSVFVYGLFSRTFFCWPVHRARAPTRGWRRSGGYSYPVMPRGTLFRGGPGGTYPVMGSGAAGQCVPGDGFSVMLTLPRRLSCPVMTVPRLLPGDGFPGMAHPAMTFRAR